MRHFTTTEWGYFFDETNTLIGHYSTDVMEFLAAHPDYRGHIMFDYGTGDGQTDVTEVFFEEDDDEDAPLDPDALAMAEAPAATCAGAVNLLTEMQERAV